jgi:integrator complex subunit 3
MRHWITKETVLLQHVVYTVTRLIQDHGRHPHLRQNEVNLVISLLKSNFSDILSLGRDYLRLLLAVSGIPEFHALLQTMQTNPTDLDPNFISLQEIWSKPTPISFLLSRITPDMEHKLLFIAQNVPTYLFTTYFERFRQRFFPSQGFETLYPDLIRYVCAVIHPSNSILRSNIVQRWNMIQIMMGYISVLHSKLR